MDEAGEIVEEVRVENANLDDLAQRYAGAQAAIEATSNYYHIHDTLSEHLDVTVAHPKELNQIADTDKKTDRVDAKELARMVRLNSVPESYVPTRISNRLTPARRAAVPRVISPSSYNETAAATRAFRFSLKYSRRTWRMASLLFSKMPALTAPSMRSVRSSGMVAVVRDMSSLKMWVSYII